MKEPKADHTQGQSLYNNMDGNVTNDLWERSKQCECWLCKRGRKFYRITVKLPVKEREWMRGFYIATMHNECELEMIRASEHAPVLG